VSDDGRPRLARQQRVGGDGVPEVFCADEQVDIRVDLERWQQLALDVILAEGVRGLAELAVLFVSEREMAELNDSYMGKPGPTDVLAFPIDAAEAEMVQHGQPPSRGPDRAPPDPADMPLLLGDVVICPAVAARQAPEHAGTVDDEMALLVVHGVLHVLGHDHADDSERVAMQARELELLEQYVWRGPAPATFRQEHVIS
jgi:probable rRNA maturation factor